MKRMCVLLSVSFLLTILFGITGCSSSSATDVADADERILSQSIDEAVDIAPSPGEPPRQLFFEGFGAIAELYAVMEKSDDSIEDYLDYHNFSMNGLTNREDIERLLATLSTIYLPVLADITPRIIVYPEQNRMSIWYDHSNGAGYNFRVSMEPGSASDRISSLHSEGRISEEISELLRDESTQSGDTQIDNSITADKLKSLDINAIYGIIASENIRNMNIREFAMDVSGTFIILRVVDAISLSDAIDGLITFEFCSFDDVIK